MEFASPGIINLIIFVLAIYVGYHVYHTRIVNMLYGTEISYERMAALMANPKVL